MPFTSYTWKRSCGKWCNKDWFVLGEITENLSALEKDVMLRLLSGDDDVKRILREQLSVSFVLKRERSGTGFFVDFAVPESVERLSNRERFVIQGIGAKIPNLEIDASFVLFIEEGAISFLEGIAYEEWPEKIDKYELYDEKLYSNRH